jgi:uncharacterized repeat protein (TIGR03803 family)
MSIRILRGAILSAAAAATILAQQSPVLTTLHTFAGSPNDGAWPYAGVVVGIDGVLYGTTNIGGTAGSQGFGTAFSLTPPKSPGGSWTEDVLWNFGNASDDGINPVGLTLASSGVFYGATSIGGTRQHGTVFSLTPPAAPRGDWTEAIVHSFYGGDDGDSPQAGPTIGPGGLLYGTTYFGGFPEPNGTVYALEPPAEAPPEVIHFFAGGDDGAYPTAPVAAGSGGVLYGTTSYGGTAGGGTVFSMKPPDARGGAWTETVLYQFSMGPNDSGQSAVVGIGAKGLLYGTTAYGGASSDGTVFMLQAPTTKGGNWTQTVLYNFSGSDGAYPSTGVLLGSGGQLYGTTSSGGTSGWGTVFVLNPPASPDGVWTETVLYNFTDGADGAKPNSLAIDSKGVLYGTTVFGGTTVGGACIELGCGTVFSLAP